jgi:hypothetical protein
MGEIRWSLDRAQRQQQAAADSTADIAQGVTADVTQTQNPADDIRGWNQLYSQTINLN